MNDINKTIYLANALQSSNPTTIQYQATDGVKQPKIEGQKNSQQSEYPTFYANVNMIHKLTPTSQAHASTVNIAQLSDDSKTCYIAQPAYGYNYALVNQVQLAQNGVAGITVDGRLQVNPISNISFKCDVCGMIFPHLTLLNQHKRTHNQDNNDTASEGITIVTQAQNLVQAQSMVQAQNAQNLVAENGQNLGQIQIVATECLEPPNQGIQQASNEVTVQTTTKPMHIDKNQKCITCGGSILLNPKRKGPKLIRCETCINSDNNKYVTSNRATQIYVASDGDVKFEMGEIPNQTSNSDSSIDSIANMTINNSQIHQLQLHQQQQHQQNPIVEIKYQPGHHPVKKRNMAAVTKCQKCNGSGYVLIGGKREKQQQAEKPFHCNVCGGSFSRYSSLWSHKKLHSGEKNYKCPICGLAFAKAVYLKNHSRIHTGEKPYKCGICGMQFSQSPHLKNHERTHSGEKPYVCEVCDKGFARHATLWNHRRIHTGEKPYKCEICGSAFSQAAHLKNHAKVHSGEKPFKCDICSAAFADRFALKRHRGIHEKYGQTAPRQSAQPQTKEELPDIEEESKIQHEVVITGM